MSLLFAIRSFPNGAQGVTTLFDVYDLCWAQSNWRDHPFELDAWTVKML
jgi:hypothetical protein